jgi:hypothetical protein
MRKTKFEAAFFTSILLINRTLGSITKVDTVTAKSGLRKQMILHFKVISKYINWIITWNAWDQIWTGIFSLSSTDTQGTSGPITKMINVTVKTGLRHQMIPHIKGMCKIYRWLGCWYTFLLLTSKVQSIMMEECQKIEKWLHCNCQRPISDPKWPQNETLPT